MRWHPVATPLVFLLLAVLWTWPAALTFALTPAGVPGLWPDALGTTWFIDASPRLLPGLDDPLTGFPTGAHYGRPDSFLLMAIAVLLAWLPPTWVYGLVTVLGVTLSAWAAERLAAELGAEPPWSLLAGAGYAFCGLASTALVEGYPYHVLNPWLPLMTISWLRTLGPRARPRDGVLTGAWFALTLLSSAWLGLSAALILAVLGCGIGVARRRRLSWPTVALALGIVGAVGALYVALFLHGGLAVREGGGVAPVANQLRISLAQSAGPGLGADVRWHSQNNGIGAVVPSLAVASAFLLRRGTRWKALLGAGLLSLLLSLSPRIDADVLAAAAPAAFGPPLRSLWGGFWHMLAGSLLRFPARLGWGWALCGSAVAALCLTVIGRRRPRAALVLLLAVLVDIFAVQRLPIRQGRILASAPSAYQAGTGPVLDVFPQAPGDDPQWTLWTTNLACHYQTVHHRPIADHCLFVAETDSPRLLRQGRIIDGALSGTLSPTLDALRAEGFTTVMLHPDHFAPADGERIAAALRAATGAPAESTDGGEHVLAFALQ